METEENAETDGIPLQAAILIHFDRVKHVFSHRSEAFPVYCHPPAVHLHTALHPGTARAKYLG